METGERPRKVSAGAELLTEPAESGMLSLTPQGFEDLQETYASRLHQGRREGLCKGKGQEKRKSKREEAHITSEDHGKVPS